MGVVDEEFGADQFSGAYGGEVVGFDDGVVDAQEGARDGGRGGRTVGLGQVEGGVLDPTDRGEIFFGKGDRVDQRLEGRADLPLGHRGAVERAALVIASADHGANRSGGRVEGVERRLQDAALFAARIVGGLFDFGEGEVDHAFGGVLEAEVDGGINHQAALGNLFGGEMFLKELADFVLIITSGEVGARAQGKRLRLSLLALGGGDDVFLFHA